MSGAPRRAAGDGSGATNERLESPHPRAGDASVAETSNELLRRTYPSAPSDLAAVIAGRPAPSGRPTSCCT